MSNGTSRKEVEFDISKNYQQKYATLLKEARKQAQDSAKDAPRRTRKNYRVEDDAIYWEVRISRFTGKWIILGFLLFPLTIPYSIFILPFQGFTKVWSHGKILLPEELLNTD